VRGALAAGLRAAWIHRDAGQLRMLAPPALTLPDLVALADRLDAERPAAASRAKSGKP
jgi:hypothetical protein